MKINPFETEGFAFINPNLEVRKGGYEKESKKPSEKELKEYELILQKKSKLSRKERDRIVNLIENGKESTT